MNHLKVASLNLCLGLYNKLNYISQLLNTKKIDVLFLQETEIQSMTDTQMYNIRGYSLEISPTLNSGKARSCAYIKNTLNYKIIPNTDPHLELIKVKIQNTVLIGFYRTFKLVNHPTHLQYLESAIEELKNSIVQQTIIIGDFNLDALRQHDVRYQSYRLYNLLSEFLVESSMIRINNTPTWSRIVNDELRESLLDHIYTNDITKTDHHTEQLAISDHKLICVNINFKTKQSQSVTFIRDWSKYSKDVLRNRLSQCNFNELAELDSTSLASELNQRLGTILDDLCPILKVKSGVDKSLISPKLIKLTQKRKLLYNKFKKSRTTSNKNELKSIEKKIRSTLRDERVRKIRTKINPNDHSSLWKAVKVAKNISIIEMPQTIVYNNQPASTDQEKAHMMMDFFDTKIKNIVKNLKISQNVNNGKRQYLNLTHYNPNTDATEIKKLLQTMTSKNCCGYDRIPMSFLVDGREELSDIIAILFNKILDGDEIPELWKISKITPLYKKGAKNDANNYRPISNICSIGKLFEKWILLRVNELEESNNTCFTGTRQHGFKKKHSTLTAMMELQSEIAEHLDNNEYVAMVSLDLSAAFDVVNHNLLIKRLRIKGLPNHLINIVQNWLSRRMMYVDVNGKCSAFKDIDEGTLQGSVLGPVLFAMFISPIYETANLTTFADDNYLLEHDKDIGATIGKVKMKAELVIKWLKESGMKVNTEKTELCVFSDKDMRRINVIIDNEMITSSLTIKVLGVLFDSKLNWQQHVDTTIQSCCRSLHAINLIKNFFNQDERLHLVNAFLYSKLYYCSTIWLVPTLKANYFKKLKGVSARALKMVVGDDFSLFSYDELHCMFNRATPHQWSRYQHALQLFKVYNFHIPEQIWIELCDRITISERTLLINIRSENKKRIGLNKFINRINETSQRIKVNDLDLSLDSFKVKMKKEFIY